MTYTNAPALALWSAGAFRADTWPTIDLTSLVSGNGLVSLVITSTNDTAISFSSREGANPPQLILIVDL
jgi:hypothetical protein